MRTQSLNTKLKVCRSNLVALKQGKDLLVHQGGRGSRKTYGNLDTLIFLALTNKGKPFLASVVSETMPHLKKGAMRDFKGLLQLYGIDRDVAHNKSDHMFTFSNGCQIEFFSADSPDKVRGPRRDYLFLNEVNNIPFETFDQLKGRTALATIVDYNPVAEFYVHEQILPNPEAFNYEFTVSTYLDNPYLPEGERKDIEAKKVLAETSEFWANWWRVYGKGEVGGLIGTVFQNWVQVDSMPAKFDRVVYGLDFGFSAHPTALVKVGIKGGSIYIQELFYRTGALNVDIIKAMELAGIKKGYDEVFADSAEPKTIQEIYNAGFNIKGAAKGKDSVNAGIAKLQEFDMHVTKGSLNMIKELRNYMWVKDKQGKATNKPVDQFNHAIDAVRYAIEPLFMKTKKVEIL